MTQSIAPTDNWSEIRAEAEQALTPKIVGMIERARDDEHKDGHLISILHEVQAVFGYLGEPQMNAVAQLLGVPTSRVSGVATFYHYFRLQPKGRFAVSCCMGTACYVRGGDRVADKFREQLGIDFGHVTKDGQFSLDSAACLGTCGLAPVVMVNDRVHSKVAPEEVPGLLERLKRDESDD
jgi:NADH:ubiquinone oxidoreductase subunit E